MMSALEREIMEKFHQLPPAAKQRIHALINQELASQGDQAATFDYASWFREAETLRQQIQASSNQNLPPIDVVGILRDIRDGEDE